MSLLDLVDPNDRSRLCVSIELLTDRSGDPVVGSKWRERRACPVLGSKTCRNAVCIESDAELENVLCEVRTSRLTAHIILRPSIMEAYGSSAGIQQVCRFLGALTEREGLRITSVQLEMTGQHPIFRPVLDPLNAIPSLQELTVELISHRIDKDSCRAIAVWVQNHPTLCSLCLILQPAFICEQERDDMNKFGADLLVAPNIKRFKIGFDVTNSRRPYGEVLTMTTLQTFLNHRQGTITMLSLHQLQFGSASEIEALASGLAFASTLQGVDFHLCDLEHDDSKYVTLFEAIEKSKSIQDMSLTFKDPMSILAAAAFYKLLLMKNSLQKLSLVHEHYMFWYQYPDPEPDYAAYAVVRSLASHGNGYPPTIRHLRLCCLDMEATGYNCDAFNAIDGSDKHVHPSNHKMSVESALLEAINDPTCSLVSLDLSGSAYTYPTLNSFSEGISSFVSLVQLNLSGIKERYGGMQDADTVFLGLRLLKVANLTAHTHSLMQLEIEGDHTYVLPQQARIEAEESVQRLNLFLRLNNHLPTLRHDGLTEVDVIQALADFAHNVDCLFRIVKTTAPLVFK
jgi:hypothetical protein